MAKPKTTSKQQRDAIELTVAAQKAAKALFPDLVSDVDAMETVENEIYDLLNDNPEASEEDIIGDIRKAIEATKAVSKSVTPDHVFLMFERMMKKEMF
jgi:hypothetical protein